MIRCHSTKSQIRKKYLNVPHLKLIVHSIIKFLNRENKRTIQFTFISVSNARQWRC